MRRKGGGSYYRRGDTFWIKYYRNGKPHRESTGSNLERVAKDLLNKRMGAIAAGRPILAEGRAGQARRATRRSVSRVPGQRAGLPGPSGAAYRASLQLLQRRQGDERRYHDRPVLHRRPPAGRRGERHDQPGTGRFEARLLAGDQGYASKGHDKAAHPRLGREQRQARFLRARPV